MEHIAIYSAIEAIALLLESMQSSDHEHRYKLLANTLLTHYFPTSMGFIVGPEQRLASTGGIPDFGVFQVRRQSENGFMEYCFVEVKRSDQSWGRAENQLAAAMSGIQAPCYAILLIGVQMRFLIFDPFGPDSRNWMTPVVPRGWQSDSIWNLRDQRDGQCIDHLFRRVATTLPHICADNHGKLD